MSISPDIEHAKSVFQIPKKWFADIDESVKGMYGVNMVQVNHDGQEGAIEVKVDEVMLSNFVKSIASETSSGTVAAVDGVLPDNTGNVNFNFQSDKWLKTDGNGHIKTTDEQPVTVLSTEHGFLYNDNGALQYKDYGVSADTVARGNHTHGNITNDGKLSGCVGTSCLVVTDNSGNIIHSDGILSEQSWAGSDVQTLVNLVGAFEWDENTGKPKVSSIKSVDGVYPNSTGNVELKSIRHIAGQAEPDADGLVTLTGYVKSVNNLRPDANGNVSVDLGGTVKSVDNIQPDVSGNVTLTGYVKSVNNVVPGANGNVTLDIPQTYVQSIDGLTGEVSLEGTYAPIEHTHTTDDITDWDEATMTFMETTEVATRGVTAGLDWTDTEHYVCPTNHGHKASDIVDLETGLSGVVKLSGDQTVNGEKTFTSEIAVYKNNRRSALSEQAVTIGGNSILTFENDVNYYLDNAPNVPKTDLASKVIATCGYINTTLSNVVTLDTEQEISATKTFKSAEGEETEIAPGAITTKNRNNTQSASLMFGSLTLHSVDMTVVPPTTIGSIDVKSGNLEIFSSRDVILKASANAPKLQNQPTDTSETSLAIATCGYVQSQLSSATGSVKTVQDVAPGDDGNVDLSEVFAEKEHTHTTDDITDWDEATQLFVETTEVETDGVVIDGTTSHERYVCPTKHKHTLDAIQGAIKTVDGHQADENGAVSFGLTPDKYVKADASGHLTSYSGTLLEVPEGKTPFNGTFKCVTNVTWNGTQLVIASKNLEFTNGVLTSASDNANTTIATTTYSGS